MRSRITGELPGIFLSTLSLRRATYMDLLLRCDYTRFLSTLSLRRATRPRYSFAPRFVDFYPRSPCGERLALARQLHGTLRISIHALLAESDSQNAHLSQTLYLFLSTLSLRRATPLLMSSCVSTRYFYPRSPCGERPQMGDDV